MSQALIIECCSTNICIKMLSDHDKPVVNKPGVQFRKNLDMGLNSMLHLHKFVILAFVSLHLW